MRTTGPIPLVDPLLGTQVGEYRVEAVIGEGGMGVVYRGTHPIIGKVVAIKVLKASLAKNKGLTERLIEEARAVNAIGHRNIIDIFGLGELPDGRPYIIMEQLAGEPLDAMLRREGKLSEKAAIALTLELAVPLEAAHRAGVVHRDLKPANVFLCDADDAPRFVKLLDFGLARRTGGFGTSTAQTNRAFIVGTPNYLSPEQASGGDISDRTDVYALGVMLFEFVTGQLPFTANTPLEIAMAHVNHQPPRVTDVAPEVSAQVSELVGRMLSKRAEERPSVEEVRRVLAPTAPVRVAPAPKAMDSGRLHRELTVTMMRPRPALSSRVWVAAGAALVVLIAGLGWALARTSGAEPVAVRGTSQTVATGTSPTVATGTLPTDATATPPTDATATPPTDATATPPTAATGTSPPVATGTPPTVATGTSPTDATGTPPTGATGPSPTGSAEPVKTPRPRAEPRVPSVEDLTRRVAALEKRLRAQTPKGEEPDPAALRLLGSYRLKAELASAPADRLEVNRKLDAFQRAHP